MLRPLRALPLAVLAAGMLSAGCLFGGSDGTISAQRPGSIPTATPPATLPEPIVVGETQAGATGSTTGAVSGEATYVVKSGDTLGGIATQLGIPAAQQAAWVLQVLQLNGIPDASLLQAGVELRLPRVQPTPRPTGSPAATAAVTSSPGAVARTATTAPTTAAAASSTTSPSASATPRPTVVSGGAGTYTVVSGDFPILIAQKLGVPESQQAAWANQLIALNGIDPSALQVGQVLQLPPIPTPAPTSTP